MGDNCLKKLHNEKSPQKSKKRGIISIVLVMLFYVVVFATQTYVRNNAVVIHYDRVTIHAQTRAFNGQALLSILTGGYEVLFEDIANIELLPYSARQLNDMIDSLNVPDLGGGPASWAVREQYAGYRGEYRFSQVRHIPFGLHAMMKSPFC